MGNIYIYSVDIDYGTPERRKQVEIKAADKIEAIRKVIASYAPIMRLWGIDRVK